MSDYSDSFSSDEKGKFSTLPLYVLDDYNLDEDMKRIISDRLISIDNTDLNFHLLVASLFVLTRNGWKLDGNIEALCDDARRSVLLRYPIIAEEEKSLSPDRDNINRCILRYCRYILSLEEQDL